MKRSSILFLQSVLVLIGLAALAFLLIEPHFEGRNAQATFLDVYFKDPFLAYVYVGSTPFFIGLFQGVKTLRYVRENKTFSPETVKGLRTIKLCAIALICFVAASALFLMAGDPEDRPQGVMMRVVVIFASVVVAAAAAVFERILQNAVEIKTENDLTV
jgi:hypothetical protein